MPVTNGAMSAFRRVPAITGTAYSWACDDQYADTTMPCTGTPTPHCGSLHSLGNYRQTMSVPTRS